mgnify:CR=1 FL=1
MLIGYASKSTWSADLNQAMAPFRCLQGIEVDILEDGGLDQEDALLAELDVVVSSVHSKLRSDSETMTHRMVGGIANPRTNILGHCTGRLDPRANAASGRSRFSTLRSFSRPAVLSTWPWRSTPVLSDGILRPAAENGDGHGLSVLHRH